MMDMAESRFRPKPRPRQKSPAQLIVSSNGSGGKLNSKCPSSLPSKPPVVKPKPRGYKPCEFNSQGLVTISKDIDIDDGSVTSTVSENVEKNNNILITNVKDAGVLGNISGNSTRNAVEKPENISGLSQSYNKPLPPIPVEDSDDPVEENQNRNIFSRSNVASSDSNGKANDNLGSLCTPPLPIKPPRMRPFSSESQLRGQNTKPGTLLDRPSVSLTNLIGNSDSSPASGHNNPPLPRKPTVLRRPFEPNEENSGALRPFSLPSQPGFMTNVSVVIEDSAQTGVRRSAPEMAPSSDKNNRNNNIGRTPPLPRKPFPKKLKPTSVGSSPDDTTQAAFKNRTSSTSEDKLSHANMRPETELAVKQDNSNSWLSNRIPEGHGSAADNRHGRPGSSPRSTGSGPPQKALPPLPRDNTKSRSAARRPPPGLPKQPSLERKHAPPLPAAPRPKSVFPDQGAALSRSMSEGDLVDQEYWVAYQHLVPSEMNSTSSEGVYEDPDARSVKAFMDSVESKQRSRHSESNDGYEDMDHCVVKNVLESAKKRTEFPRIPEKSVESPDGGYEAPDGKIVKEFMESTQRKKEHQMKKKIGPVKIDKSRGNEHTYSSSSDDSDHEYIEPDDPIPSKESSPELVSSGSINSRSSYHNYIEPIHIDDSSKPAKTTENVKKKLEFKPFSDMSEEWLEPKVIDWDYEGESDDSEASYIEPDEEDVFDLDVEEEEPLYQIYQANVLEKERTLSLKRSKKGSNSQALPRPPSFSNNVTLRSGTLGKMLWCHLPEVRNSGMLDSIAGEQRKIQEAIYEVISSEASYLKSLNLLVDHFLKAFSVDLFDPILDQKQFSELFSNIREIVAVSESLLKDLKTRQRQSLLVESISDIITDHATNCFNVYVTYCSSQYKQDRVLSQLRNSNYRFAEALDKLEKDARVIGLTLQSFLVLPMQRVTRYPLLVDAIVRRCESGCSEYYKTDEALKAVNQIVHKCNEGARNEERREEMIQIVKIIAFLKVKSIQLLKTDRWLLRRGPLQLLEFDSKMTFSNTLRKLRKYRYKTIYLFVFNDLLVVTKKKSETMYSVIDYANRNMIRVQESKSTAKNSFVLLLLENVERKTKELNVRADTETEMTRWREAFQPSGAESDDEKIYGTWDCPQVHALHNYQPQQPDELSLVPGDVVNVLRKLPDGWYEGERIRDGLSGWFPANHTEEIRNEHVRARNLHQRYRLLAASTAYLDKKKR